jgi:hypothetical protein
MCHQQFIVSKSVDYFVAFVGPVACILCLLFSVHGADDTQGISRVTWNFSSVWNYPCINNFTKRQAQNIFSGIMQMCNCTFPLCFELYLKVLYNASYVSS